MDNRKCVLITGASSNIGQGIAVSLASRGYNIAFSWSENKDGAEDTIKLCEAYGVTVKAFQAQLNEADGPEKLVKEAHEAFGRIDALVSNAGRSFHKSVIGITREEMEDIFHLDFRGYMLCAKAAAKYMIADGIAGSITFISSSQGDQAYPGGFLYCGVKAAVNQACKSLAMDLAHYGIRVNVVAPGAIRSYSKHPSPKKIRQHAKNGTPEKAYEKVEELNNWPFTKGNIPMKRMGSPSDIGETVAFMISEGAAYITGITVRVDGGLILPGIMQGAEPFIWADQMYWNKQREISGAFEQGEESAVPAANENGVRHIVVLSKYGNAAAYIDEQDDNQVISCISPENLETEMKAACEKYGPVTELIVDFTEEITGSVINADAELLDEVFKKRFITYAIAVREAAISMIQNGIRGNMILIMGNHARRAAVTSFLGSAMDAAMEHALRCMAIDLGHYGIRVNGIAVSTEMNGTNEVNIPLRETAHEDNIAKIITFLEKSEMGCVTGDTIYADFATSLPTASEGRDFVPWCPQEYWDSAYKKAFDGQAQ